MHFTTKMSVVRPFSVLSKDEIGPESKTGRFLSKAEILGVEVLSPLSINQIRGCPREKAFFLGYPRFSRCCSDPQAKCEKVEKKGKEG